MAGKGAARRFLALAVPALLLVLMAAGGSFARDVTDMVGRKVAVNQSIQRVWPAYPPIAYLLYALDPSLSIGWPGPLPASGKKYLRSGWDLPVVGGWFGQRTPNLEVLAAARPDLALVWDQSLEAAPRMAETLQKMNIPVVAIRLFRITDYPDALSFLGNVLGRKERAKALATYVATTIAEMKTFGDAVPKGKKKSVYYAIGPDGLTSDCDHMPFLDEAIELAGGKNAYKCETIDRTGGRKIDIEKLLLYDPDVIITQEPAFFSRAFSDPRYGRLRAIKERRVYMIPNVPFNWLNYPPSFMRALGIRWLALTLYPESYKNDFHQEMKSFFKLFFNVELSDNDARAILRQPKMAR